MVRWEHGCLHLNPLPKPLTATSPQMALRVSSSVWNCILWWTK